MKHDSSKRSSRDPRSRGPSVPSRPRRIGGPPLTGASWRANLEQRIEAISRKVGESLGYEVLEMRYAPGSRRGLLRVILDSDQGVTLEDCARYSRELGHALDEGNVIAGAYNLEVSSPGASRPFSDLKHYRRNLMKPVEIQFKEPINEKRAVTGLLTAVEEDHVVVAPAKGDPVTIPLSIVSRAVRRLEF